VAEDPKIPVGLNLTVQPGVDGLPCVVLQMTCGTVTAAMGIPPDVADDFAKQLPQLLRETAAQARVERAKLQPDTLVRADATALVHLNRAQRRAHK
jgi:tripartite-type tricarboxylate transporter receptor subunit TctC